MYHLFIYLSIKLRALPHLAEKHALHLSCFVLDKIYASADSRLLGAKARVRAPDAVRLVRAVRVCLARRAVLVRGALRGWRTCVVVVVSLLVRSLWCQHKQI